jgi:hypothetical protein
MAISLVMRIEDAGAGCCLNETLVLRRGMLSARTIEAWPEM